MAETLILFIPGLGEFIVPVIDYRSEMGKPLDLLAALRNSENVLKTRIAELESELKDKQECLDFALGLSKPKEE